MEYRRERTIRELFEERVLGRSQPGHYQRTVTVVDKRSLLRNSENDRETDYDYARGGGGYQRDDPRGFQGERASYSGEKRSVPPCRRQEDPYSYYRESRESRTEPPASREAEFRSSSRGTSQPSIRGQRSPFPQPLTSVPVRGDNDITQGTKNPGSLYRGNERESLKRKASFSPAREHSPPKRDMPPSSHTRSSCSYSPESKRTINPQPSQTKRNQSSQDRERPPSCRAGESQDGSPHSSASETKEEVPVAEVKQSEEPKVQEEAEQPLEVRRAHVIANKALEIEKFYRQDCETFGIVVKMLIAKQPSLEKTLQAALKENLLEIKERCLEDLRNFISEVNVVLQSDQTG